MDRPSKLSALEGAAETPLHGAAWGGDLEEVKQLIAEGADVNYRDAANETPLHGAAAWGRAEVVRFLIESGAHVNMPGTTQLTPLHWAAGWGNLETVKVLLLSGADVRAKNEFGETAEQLALQRNRTEIAACIRAHDS
jgi:ankyrin repeat protein